MSGGAGAGPPGPGARSAASRSASSDSRDGSPKRLPGQGQGLQGRLRREALGQQPLAAPGRSGQGGPQRREPSFKMPLSFPEEKIHCAWAPSLHSSPSRCISRSRIASLVEVLELLQGASRLPLKSGHHLEELGGWLRVVPGVAAFIKQDHQGCPTPGPQGWPRAKKSPGLQETGRCGRPSAL